MELKIFNININELISIHWKALVNCVGFFIIFVVIIVTLRSIREANQGKEHINVIELSRKFRPFERRIVATVLIVGLFLGTFQISHNVEAVNRRDTQTNNARLCNYIGTSTYYFSEEDHKGITFIDSSALILSKRDSVKIDLLSVEKTSNVSFLFGLIKIYYNKDDAQHVNIYANEESLDKLCGDGFTKKRLIEGIEK